MNKQERKGVTYFYNIVLKKLIQNWRE